MNLLWLLVPGCFIISTCLGIYYNYSAVPFWDMWSGYLTFYYQALEQGWQAWWEQHNEHRLVLAKIFFWLDLEFFHGRMILLYVFNYLFSLAAFVTFVRVFGRLTGAGRLSLPLLLALPAAFSFSWLQEENYIWAFQSQFHMAYLFPLRSLLLLSIYAATRRLPWFLAAALLG